jgi:hypothetical protein
VFGPATVSTLVSGFGEANASEFGASGLAVDPSGNIFVPEGRQVYEIMAVNGSIPASPEIRSVGGNLGFKASSFLASR